MNTIIRTSVILLGGALTLTSCESNSKKDRVIQSIDTELVSDVAVEEKSERIKQIFYTLPSPLEITMMFKKEGVEYHADILHSTAKRKQYNGTVSKALNLGVYGADLSYSGLFARHEAAIQYFAASQILADELGIGTKFQQEFIVRLEEHAGNKDTLLKVINEFFMKNEKDLKDSERQDLSSYVLTGGWIEGMYLGTKIVNEKANAVGVRNIITNQREALHNIIVIFQNTESTETSENLLKMLGELEAIYSRIEGEMSDSDFLNIKTKIEITREYIINL